MRTYQGKIVEPGQGVEVRLDRYAALFGTASRSLFASIMRGEGVDKPAFCRQWGLTSRQFNALKVTVEGKISSLKEIQKSRIEDITVAIKALEKLLAAKVKKKGQEETELKLPRGRKRHEKARKLDRLRHVLATLEADKRAGIVRLSFGGRKLFRAQFNLEENGYVSFAQWKRDWQATRNNQFFVIGSKDETAGCQGCQITPLGNSRFRVKLRLPDALVERSRDKQTHLILEVAVPYGATELEAALEAGRALSFRFIKGAKGWRVMVSTEVAGAEHTMSSKSLGAIGVDINAGHLAVSEIDASGNPIPGQCLSVPLVTYGCSTDQANARIGDAVKQVIALAVKAGKPLVIEELNFQRKKRDLSNSSGSGNGPDFGGARGKRYARMLSSFSYSRILINLKARAKDAGIEVLEVNPAYTSIIGRSKFSGRYGISVHAAAAVAISRRALQLSERPTARQRFHGTSSVPVWNRGEHVWKYWARGLREERRLQRQSGRQNTKGDPGRPPSLGQTSLTVPVKSRQASLQHCSGGEYSGADKTLYF